MKKILSILIVFPIICFSQTGCWQSLSSISGHTLAIKDDGTLWAWGNNNYGQLGDDTTTNNLFPVQISSSTDWQQISAGTQHSIAIKSDGSLWIWGRNSIGTLGIPMSINSKIPNQLGTSQDWQTASAGANYSAAIKNDGTLWTWGGNFYGELGNGNSLENTTAPAQVGIANNWKEVVCGYEFTIAIKTDGTLRAWGYNANGQLGDNTTIDKSTPVQIGNSNNWEQIDTGFYFSVGIKTDGSLWAWGNNEFGQFGNGSIGIPSNSTNQTGTVPIQIGTTADWSQISATNVFTYGIKNDGTLWAWGKLGNGDAINSSTPVQIGTSANWTYANANGAYSINANNDLWQFTSTLTQINCTDLSVIGQKMEEYKIFPNPAQQIMYISNIEKIDYEIFDVLGKMILKGKENGNQIDVSSLMKGFYILKFSSDRKVINQKFIKN